MTFFFSQGWSLFSSSKGGFGFRRGRFLFANGDWVFVCLAGWWFSLRSDHRYSPLHRRRQLRMETAREDEQGHARCGTDEKNQDGRIAQQTERRCIWTVPSFQEENKRCQVVFCTLEFCAPRVVDRGSLPSEPPAAVRLVYLHTAAASALLPTSSPIHSAGRACCSPCSRRLVARGCSVKGQIVGREVLRTISRTAQSYAAVTENAPKEGIPPYYSSPLVFLPPRTPPRVIRRDRMGTRHAQGLCST